MINMGVGKMIQDKNSIGVQELTNGKFEEFIKKGVVLIDFFADWCMPCVMMGPVVEELSEKFEGKIKFGKVNIEDNEPISRKFKVSSIPNFIIFKDGQPVAQFVGAVSSDVLEERLRKFL